MLFKFNSIIIIASYKVFKTILTFKTNWTSRYKISKLRFIWRIFLLSFY